MDGTEREGMSMEARMEREAVRSAGVVVKETRVIGKCIEGLSRLPRAGSVDQRSGVFDHAFVLKKTIQGSKVTHHHHHYFVIIVIITQ